MRVPLVGTLLASIFFALTFAALPIRAKNEPATSRAQAAANSWTTHDDPSGFSVNTPAGWTVARDTQQGRVTIRGQRGEQAVVWPMFIEQRKLDAAGAASLVKDLARKIDGQLSWTAATPSQNVARAVAKGGQRNASAMLTWSTVTNGTEAYLYCVEAPAAIYASSTDTFVAVLTSFHVVQDPALKNAQGPAAGGAPAAISYARWRDPHEGSFSMSVPQGWQVIGGAYRLSATDIRNGVTMVSPDGRLRVYMGDSNLGVFTQPNQMLAMGGLREGGYQMLGDGTRLEIRRYMTGQQFASSYAAGPLQQQCVGLQVQSNNARPEIAATFSQLAQRDGMPGAQITAGDVSFTCSLSGRPVVGKFVVGTIVPAPGRAPLWYVYRIYGYIAPAERKDDAEKVMLQAVQTWQIDPQWQARENQTANAAVQQDNMRSQQIQSQAMAAIRKDQQETSDIITKGYEQRQQVYDEISRKRENAILGEVDVVDPETGTQYKVDNYSDYHWMNNEGYHAGTQTDTSPGLGWREMITLP
jgi:hypothetical protein